MTIEKNLFVLCENIILDASGKITLVNLYEIIYAENLPALHGKLSFAVNVRLEDIKEEDKKVKLKLLIKSPTRKDMLANPLTVEKEINTIKKVQNIGFAIVVNGVILSEYGFYEALVSINDNNLKPLIFEVSKPPKSTRAD